MNRPPGGGGVPGGPPIPVPPPDANGATLDYLDREQGADFRILWQAA